MTTNMTTKRELNIDALNMVAGGEEYRNHVMYGDCEIWANCDSSAVYGADDGKAVEYNGPLYSADGTANGPHRCTARTGQRTDRFIPHR